MSFFSSRTTAALPRHLPLPSGPHAVGYEDFMTPGSPQDGLFTRIYYPSVYPLNETINKPDLWPIWADDNYLRGFVKFMQAMLVKWPSWAPRDEYMWVNQMAVIAPIMHIGCTQMWKLLNGVVYCPILKGAPISQEKKWPVIVFSHGLGCSRFAYSLICTDLASHGFIVSAVEHREGSACYSYHLDNNGKKTDILHSKLQADDQEYEMRNQQLKHRAVEIRRALDHLIDLNAGKAVENVLKTEDDPKIFVNQFDLDKPVAAGHSFGGASTLLSLVQDERFKMGLVLDGWLFPLKDEELKPQQPIIFINTESFRNPSNISRMREFLTDELKRNMLFIKGSVHQNHIDAPLIFKSATIKKIIGMHSETSANLVMALNNKLMIDFILRNLNIDADPSLKDFLEHHQDLIIQDVKFDAEEEANREEQETKAK